MPSGKNPANLTPPEPEAVRDACQMPMLKYAPLPTASSIRLLELYDTDHEGLLDCSLHTVDPADQPDYQALSYLWVDAFTKPKGSQWSRAVVTTEPQWPIRCDSQQLWIPRSLYATLRRWQPSKPNEERDSDHGKTALHRAAEGSDKDKVWDLLAEGYDLSIRDKYGETPLHYAAENGYLDVVELCVRAGADINQKDHSQRTPIDCARQRQRGQYGEVVAFLTAWADPDNPIHHQNARMVPSGRHLFWIDVLCIDPDNIEECDSKVQILPQIYKSARRIIS